MLKWEWGSHPEDLGLCSKSLSCVRIYFLALVLEATLELCAWMPPLPTQTQCISCCGHPSPEPWACGAAQFPSLSKAPADLQNEVSFGSARAGAQQSVRMDQHQRHAVELGKPEQKQVRPIRATFWQIFTVFKDLPPKIFESQPARCWRRHVEPALPQRGH